MSPILNQKQTAKLLTLSERTLERLRVTGTGPRFVRAGRSIRYREIDVETWVASRVVGSTSEQRTDN